MSLQEIKDAVESGRTVHWGNSGYDVIKDKVGQWLVVYQPTKYCWGLTHQDGVTVNGKPEDFFIEEDLP